MMKFKLGLLIGATAGYLIGSGKGADMWADYRARAGEGAGQSLLNGESMLDLGDPVVSEAFIATSETSLRSEL